MKKRRAEKFILILAIFLLLFITFPVGSEAASDLELKQINYDAILQEDGSMDVEETWNIRITQVNTLYKTFKDIRRRCYQCGSRRNTSRWKSKEI